MTETEVLQAVRSFLAESAGGPDGVRPQHVLEMVNCVEAGPELVSALTAFTNCLLHGEVHPDVSLVLFGGNLIALEKKPGGVSPIAVGYNLLPNVPTHMPPVNWHTTSLQFSLELRFQVDVKLQSIPPDDTSIQCQTDTW